MEMTVKQLKELLEKYPDETKIIAVTNNYEMGKSLVNACVSEEKLSKTVRSFRDDFDGGSYSSKVWEHDKDGETALVIRGF